jgi:competence protein ComEC
MVNRSGFVRWSAIALLALASGACTSGPRPAVPPPSVAAPASIYPKPAQPRADARGLRAPARRAPGSARLFVPATGDAVADGPMRIHFIDVGQGAATLFEFPCGAILADTGGEAVGDFSSTERLATYLESFFARRADLQRTLDLLILSHPHIDHTRGVERIRTSFAIRRVADNGQDRSASGSAQQNALRQWALDNGIEYLPIRADEIAVAPAPDDAGVGDVAPLEPLAPCAASVRAAEVTFLWGDAGTTSGEFDNPNNSSVTFRVDWGDASALVTGDLQHAGIERLIAKYGGASDLLDADVFLAGHHGSHNATTEELVERISPKLAVFAAGDPARRSGTFNAFNFGHPNYKAVRILDDPWRGVACGRSPVDVPVGIKGKFRDQQPVWEEWTLESALFSTGWDGDVIVEARTDGALSVSTRAQQNATGFWCP